jgi:rhamnopyranosyl-N-acetylglucosaminyl-diphospho-decaprenol beta-1,3/1,4-galactofuranosyltransferase
VSTPSVTDAPTVVAVVVTYKRPEILREAIAHLFNQVPFGLAGIFISVNSADEETSSYVNALVEEKAGFVVACYYDNEGPAGGIFYGMKYFMEKTTASHVWLMDDDVIVQDDCLRQMLACSTTSGYVYPKVKTEKSDAFFSFGWSAVLLKRSVVDQVGFPIRELFYWAEDTEYLQNRLTRVFQIPYTICETALVHHLHRESRTKPSWYYYYSVRNTLYYRTYIAGYTWYRFKRTLYLFPNLLHAILFKEKNKVKKLNLFTRGVFDGLRGKIGKTINPETNR